MSLTLLVAIKFSLDWFTAGYSKFIVAVRTTVILPFAEESLPLLDMCSDVTFPLPLEEKRRLLLF